MTINFFFSKDSDGIRTMHIKRDNIDILMGIETDEIIKELFKSFLQRYQEGLEESMMGNEFVFNSVDLLQYRFQKTGSSHMDSLKKLKDEKRNNKSKKIMMIIAFNML